MDKENLIQQKERVERQLHTEMPGTEAYANLLEDLKRITTMISEMEKAENARTELNHRIDMEEESMRTEKYRAENDNRNAKWDTVWRTAGTIVGTIIMGVFGLIGIEKTVELEEDSIPSRNGYGIASRWFGKVGK